MKILFLVPYPLGSTPSQRFRFEQYFSILNSAGHSYEVQSFLKSGEAKILFQQGYAIRKIITLAYGLIQRFMTLFKLHSFDVVFIHREAAPVGPPIFEWIIAVFLRKKVIFDFDDAIWLTDRRVESRLISVVKWRSKVKSICRWSTKVSVGNEYLGAYAKKYNRCVILNPSTIDTENVHSPNRFPPRHRTDIVLGWTGSHSTLKYLATLETVLKALWAKYPNIKLIVLADEASKISAGFIHFIPWSIENEIKDLLQIDIGLMPLADDDWSRGKCGFKALQYMSLKKPALVSPVGVNASIVDHGVNGFHCKTPQDWYDSIERLIQHPDSCDEMGENGRNKVVEGYSVISNSANFLSLFE